MPKITREEINDSAAQSSSDSSMSQDDITNERNENLLRNINKMDDSIINPRKTQVDKK